jgi:hypothetical protein
MYVTISQVEEEIFDNKKDCYIYVTSIISPKQIIHDINNVKKC